MEIPSSVKPDFPRSAFAGTASYYLRYRPPYPKALLEDLLSRARTPSDARLLDLACGPGTVALAVAPRFKDVWAVDLEPEMVAVGRQEALKRGQNHIRWEVARAEALEAPAASIDLITIGSAFHRFEQDRVASHCLQWLKPGGALAILGGYGILSGLGPWQGAVVELVKRFTPAPERTNSKPLPGSTPEHYERVLKERGFGQVATYSFSEEQDWTFESILGYLHSTSVCSKVVLGAQAPDFERQLQETLRPFAAAGRFSETERFGYTLGTKPASSG